MISIVDGLLDGKRPISADSYGGGYRDHDNRRGNSDDPEVRAYEKIAGIPRGTSNLDEAEVQEKYAEIVDLMGKDYKKLASSME